MRHAEIQHDALTLFILQKFQNTVSRNLPSVAYFKSLDFTIVNQIK